METISYPCSRAGFRDILPPLLGSHTLVNHAAAASHTPSDRSERRLRWDERYASPSRPWDTGITPPEVITFWQSGLLAPRGIAIDLGCGTGTNVTFLSTLGLQAVGVDISGIALAHGQARSRQELETGDRRVSLVQSDVMQLPFAAAEAAYILDIGCLHSLPLDRRSRYARSVADNLRPGGYYHLFAFDRDRSDSAAVKHRDQGMEEDEVRRLFTPALAVLTVLRGRPDQRPCRWYLLRKPLTA